MRLCCVKGIVHPKIKVSFLLRNTEEDTLVKVLSFFPRRKETFIFSGEIHTALERHESKSILAELHHIAPTIINRVCEEQCV